MYAYMFSRKKKTNTDKLVIFDLKHVLRERCYAQLIYFFHRNNYSILLKNNPLFLGNLTTYGKSIASLENVKLFSGKYPSKKSDSLYFFDGDRPSHFYKKNIKVSDDIYSHEAKNNTENFLPYPMIPRLYYQGFYDNIYMLRGVEKSMRIYFSGNQNPADYDNSVFRTFHQKLNRIEILNILKEELREHEIEILDDVSQNVGRAYQCKFILHRWVRKSLKSNDIKGRVSNENWLSVLSRAEFFLACPGFIQPLCHNLIEAMSLGVIPILEHPELLNPPLENGKNCIVFSGKKQLVEKIREVLAMQEEQIQQLRANVIDYYEKYLSPESFCAKLEGRKENRLTLYGYTDSYVYKKLMNAV